MRTIGGCLLCVLVMSAGGRAQDARPTPTLPGYDDAALEAEREAQRIHAAKKRESRKNRPKKEGGAEVVYRHRLNLGFENASHPAGWSVAGDGYRGRVVEGEGVAHAGDRCLEIEFVEPGTFGAATGVFPVSDALGKRIRMHGYLKTRAITRGYAGLWMRVDGPDGLLEFDGMAGRGVTGTTDWRRYEIELDVPESAVNVNFGALLTGDGTVWVDGLELEVVEAGPRVPGTVSGVVVAASGKPAAGALVALIPADDLAPAVTGETSADGRYELRAPPGEYAVTATHGDGFAAYHPVFELGARGDRDVPLELAASGFAVTGRVTLSGAGGGAAGASVCALRASEVRGDVFCTTSAADGRYRLPLMSGRYFGIVVDGSGYRRVIERRDLAGAAVVDLEVDDDRQLRAPTPEAVVAWIGGRAIPLGHLEAGNGFEDLAPLDELIGDARIVGVGEATHGSREIFQLKHRLFEYLVSEHGFTVLGIEANYADSLAVDAYVRTGQGTALAAVAGLGSPTWDTEEMVALVEWMRRYNAGRDRDRAVRFIGFDMQPSAAAVRGLADYLAMADPGYGADRAVLLDRQAMVGQLTERVEGEPGDTPDGLAEVLARLESRRGDYVARTGSERYDVALRLAGTLLQAEALASGELDRDRAMADNVGSIVRAEPDGARVMLWAHNAHVSRSPLGGEVTPMGRHLGERFGDGYLSVGFAFGEGGFQAVDRTRGRGRELAGHRLGPAPTGSIGACMARTGLDRFALDLRSVPESGEVANWFRSPRLMRVVGSAYRGEEASTWTLTVTDHFDALLYVDSITRARPNPTGLPPASEHP